MAQGGRRLADLLTTLFATGPVPLNSSTLTNGDFACSWAAIAGRTYRIQWKQQLSDTAWMDLTNVTAAASSASFTEPATATRRFYRVVQ